MREVAALPCVNHFAALQYGTTMHFNGSSLPQL